VHQKLTNDLVIHAGYYKSQEEIMKPIHAQLNKSTRTHAYLIILFLITLQRRNKSRHMAEKTRRKCWVEIFFFRYLVSQLQKLQNSFTITKVIKVS